MKHGVFISSDVFLKLLSVYFACIVCNDFGSQCITMMCSSDSGYLNVTYFNVFILELISLTCYSFCLHHCCSYFPRSFTAGSITCIE